MRLKFGGGIVDGRGSIAGNVFTHANSNPSAKAFVMPVRRNSFLQQTFKAIFSRLAGTWTTLTPAQQEAWKAIAPLYAKKDSLGQKVVLTGQQLFRSLNGNLLVANSPTISNPLPPIEMPYISVLSFFQFSSSRIRINIRYGASQSTTIPANTTLVLSASPPQTLGTVHLQPHEIRVIRVQGGGGSNALEITAPWIERYGQWFTGQRIFVKAHLVSEITGQRSNTMTAFQDAP